MITIVNAYHAKRPLVCTFLGGSDGLSLSPSLPLSLSLSLSLSPSLNLPLARGVLVNPPRQRRALFHHFRDIIYIYIYIYIRICFIYIYIYVYVRISTTFATSLFRWPESPPALAPAARSRYSINSSNSYHIYSSSNSCSMNSSNNSCSINSRARPETQPAGGLQPRDVCLFPYFVLICRNIVLLFVCFLCCCFIAAEGNYQGRSWLRYTYRGSCNTRDIQYRAVQYKGGVLERHTMHGASI